MLQERSIVKAIIYSIVTCGLYGIYWFIQMTDEAHQAVGRETTASGVKAFIYSLLSCGIYTFYWMYKMGQTVAEAQEKRGMHVENDAGMLYCVFTLFGLAIVSEALLQKSLNEIAVFDQQQAAMDAQADAMDAAEPAGHINLLKK